MSEVRDHPIQAKPPIARARPGAATKALSERAPPRPIRPNLAEPRIGTSGWHYQSWWGPFFPEGLRKKDALRYYVTRFNATELNAPFYRTPTLEAVQGWFDQSPEDFRFAWKASKFITHWKQLSERCDNSLELMETRLALLRHKVGPILFQLPPKMHANRERLASFLTMLNPARRYTFEFRHQSWYEAPIFELLREHDAALCLSDHAAAPAPREVAARWLSCGGYGPSGRYPGHRRGEPVGGGVAVIRRWRGVGGEGWCRCGTGVKSPGPQDARRRGARLGQDG